MRRRLGVPAVVLVVLVQTAARAPAQGRTALETDDPGTPGAGQVELNLSVEAEHEAGRTVYDRDRRGRTEG